MCFLALKMSLGFCVNRLVPQDKNACLGKQPTKSRQKDIQFLLRLCQDCLNPRPPPMAFWTYIRNFLWNLISKQQEFLKILDFGHPPPPFLGNVQTMGRVHSCGCWRCCGCGWVSYWFWCYNLHKSRDVVVSWMLEFLL